MNSYSAHVRRLKASIRPEDLRTARESIAGRRRRKQAKSVGKAFAIAGGFGLSIAAVVGLANAAKKER